MAQQNPALSAASAIDPWWYLYNAPRLQERLAEVDGAIAAGGSSWHLMELRAERDDIG